MSLFRNYKEYKSIFFQNDVTELSKEHQKKRFVRAYFDASLDTKVTESWSNGKVIKVFYHEINHIKQVHSFHKAHYATLPFSLFQIKNSHTFFVENYKNFEFQSLEIFRFDAFGREIEALLFLKDFSLSQYNESIYENDDDELPVKEKTFYPKLWQIEEEDMD
ncbi:hypothetical protein [Aureispira sp. CCB-E]|uniref:hypothetical protein n=1 Tax=Aureispira sp. CCB-E TaxID=3051121 RepID=UPI0028692C73|nr:hypothetical protein [Aureispira sp. CCB-E]WMX16029.1 hypothetical protein QP953_06590 [Aureispira sp. CCB-E]